MFDRTTLDLRIAEHAATTGRVNRQGWRQGQGPRPPRRAALAALLVTLAGKLDPSTLLARQARNPRPAPPRA